MSLLSRVRQDLLALPLIGRFLRWRYARFVLQLPLLLVAFLALYDGFLGRQLAPKNFATVSVWLHYRGFLVLAVAVLGNLFCAACPLMLVRGPTRWAKRFLPQFRRPRPLRNKYFVIVLTLFYLFAYEYWDLWASPWLTAWLILGYFGVAFLVDAFFPEGTFCKYVCPLGNFNFTLSTTSPAQITAKDPSVCLSCEGKYCVNGRVETPDGPKTAREASPVEGTYYPGCETRLYVPQIQSNMDCTLCFNCLRACPYDNVALKPRFWGAEWIRARYRLDWVWLGVLLFFAGFMNAFAMVPAYYRLAEGLSKVLGTTNEGLLLITIYALWTGLGFLLVLLLSGLASRLAGFKEPPMKAVRRWGVAFFPLAFAMWTGHYAFHFLTGWASIVPVTQQALIHLGLPLPEPDWTLAALVPENLLYPLQVVILYLGLAGATITLFSRAKGGRPLGAAFFFLMLFFLVALALWVLAQPMEMRGTLLLPKT
jgi:ferredoxin